MTKPPAPSIPPPPPESPSGRQLRIPFFFDGCIQLGDEVQVIRQGTTVWYFVRGSPVYGHGVDDIASFRFYTSMLCDHGLVKLVEVERAFGVSAISVKRALKRYRAEGAKGFFQDRKPKVMPRVWSTELLAAAQELLDAGYTCRQVGERLGIKPDTVYRAVKVGKLYRRSIHQGAQRPEQGEGEARYGVTTAGERSAADHAAAAEMGTACHDIVGRTAAMLGRGGPAEPHFESAVDIPSAGLLCAIPALIANGLLHQVDKTFTMPLGYYPLIQLFLLFAFLILARVRSFEQARNQLPGEWGRLLGLDRMPEVKTLRRKLELLAEAAAVGSWAEAMSRFWMEVDPELAGVLYVDGHVRTYHGSQTRLPARFSSRERLCVHSFMDYWVNDREGTPFFVVTAVGTEGLLHHLRNKLIPRLLKEVPGQPGEEALAADPRLHRFIIVFDREGWSPKFFGELWEEHRIAVMTYRKGHYEPWPSQLFAEQVVTLPHGNQIPMKLAELSCDQKIPHGTNVLFREIRRLSQDSEHQTAILTTVQTSPMVQIAGHMFARWSQENFLNYASRELAIDRLGGHALGPAPGKAEVRNPAWRLVDQRARRLRAERAALEAERGRLQPPEQEGAAMETYITKVTALGERLAICKKDLQATNAQLRELPRRIPIDQLPEKERPGLIAQPRHELLAILKITAYRAETALVRILREHLGRSDDARALAKDIFRHGADLMADLQAKTLTVRLHHFTNPQASRAVHALLTELTEAKTLYPGTDLVLQYELVSDPVPRSQEP